jgi:hypothetical protein
MLVENLIIGDEDLFFAPFYKMLRLKCKRIAILMHFVIIYLYSIRKYVLLFCSVPFEQIYQKSSFHIQAFPCMIEVVLDIFCFHYVI